MENCARKRSGVIWRSRFSALTSSGEGQAGRGALTEHFCAVGADAGELAVVRGEGAATDAAAAVIDT